jgi:hypothetical protein
MKKNKNLNYEQTFETSYFGLSIRVFTTTESETYYTSFPWRYEIEYDNKIISFSGIPNYLESKRKALKKAWFRAKWISDGEFNNKYK